MKRFFRIFSRLYCRRSSTKRVYVFIGEIGSGKDYAGNVAHELTGWPVYHADKSLIDDMKRAIAAGETFTPEMREAYTRLIAQKTRRLLRRYDAAIVTQAFYFQCWRNLFEDILKSKGIDVVWIQVAADQKIREKRIGNREGGVSLDYAKKLPAFEPLEPFSFRFAHNNSSPLGGRLGEGDFVQTLLRKAPGKNIHVIRNDEDGKQAIIRQLHGIFGGAREMRPAIALKRAELA